LCRTKTCPTPCLVSDLLCEARFAVWPKMTPLCLRLLVTPVLFFTHSQPLLFAAPVSAARAAVAGLGQLDVRTEVKSGLATQYESKLGLSHWKSLFAGRDFGLPKVMTAAESVGTELFNRDALGNPVEDVALSGGSQLQRILKDTYKVELPLRSDLGYGYKVYSLSGKTVYCIGQRVGQRFVYDRAAMDPITLVRKEFEPAEFDNTMVFGVGGAALFGSIAVACLFGASGGGGGGDGRDH
jgi:hypothetical protein